MAPAGAGPTPVTCKNPGKALQGAAGWIDGRRVDKHESSWRTGDLERDPSTRSFLHAPQGRRSNHSSGWKRLTERQDRARGWDALRRYVERVGNARVPYEHREGATPLGQWVAEQRRAFGARQMTSRRARRLEGLGMVWDVADAAFEENLAACRAYFEQHFTLCAPRTAGALGKPGGQLVSNLRRPGALDRHPERAAVLVAIDPDWNPAWPVSWQRHYAAVPAAVGDGDGAQFVGGVGAGAVLWLTGTGRPTGSGRCPLRHMPAGPPSVPRGTDGGLV
ncbi:helicase associated domain-containing protein [Streptomyces sp. NPDC020377]|uniref:helicase associated domain-containing protein n=1 Tax=Streptomyces sp. NPDC020377 TaxID=3365070 RepID=UPI00379855E7